MTQDVAPDASAAVLPSTCTLYLGDCLQIMPDLKIQSLAMIFADIPFGSTQNEWDKRFDTTHLWAAIARVSTSDTVSIFAADLNLAVSLIPASSQKFRYEIIWDKTRASSFAYARHRPLRSHELLLVFANNLTSYNPQKTFGHIGRKRENKALIASRNGGPIPCARPTTDTRFPLSVLPIKRDDPRLQSFKTHPTQKPVALLEWLIKTYTNPGDTVLDPVFGSCTTGVACARLGRSFIGIEKDPEYFRISRERVDAERAKLGLQPCDVKV